MYSSLHSAIRSSLKGVPKIDYKSARNRWCRDPVTILAKYLQTILLAHLIEKGKPAARILVGAYSLAAICVGSIRRIFYKFDPVLRRQVALASAREAIAGFNSVIADSRNGEELIEGADGNTDSFFDQVDKLI